jgi:integrase
MADNYRNTTTMIDLTAAAVKRIDKKPGRHSFGDGLNLYVKTPALRYWTYRCRIAGRQTELTLGPYPETSIKDARAAHAEKRAQVLKKIDPIALKHAKRRAYRSAANAATIPSFGETVDRFIASREHDWTNAKHRWQWTSTMGAGGPCEPIRALPVDKLTTAAIHDLLEPLWRSMPTTASRIRGRIEQAWDFARVRGHIAEDKANPARRKGHLDKLLAKPPQHVNHAALPYAETPHFMQRLRQRGEKETAARLLEFTVLTAARSDEAASMTWDEVDLDEKVWAVPESRMKARKPHRVPLSDRAIEILRRQYAERDERNPFVFPGTRPQRPLSNMAMTMVLRRMGVTVKVNGKAKVVTMHGFRSTLRDWAGDETHFPREVAEAALAHTVGGVEGDYRRSDAFNKRRQLMDAWAAYCDGAPEGQVIPFAAARSL